MPELPSGTVTFLFTDIERSTETMAAIGNEAYADALDTHRQLLRDAFKAHGGHEIGTEGDSFFIAFALAKDAVEAAVAGQRVLDSHPLHVRMGMHTGEALVRGSEYVGHDVHKAKRVSDAGNGGQVLVSQTTADLVRDFVDLRDLGPHRLKDLGEPQRIFQVGTKAFPPLRSLEAFRHSLPVQRSTFIGREKEIAEIRELIKTSRIVTLSGVGGSGKTRLAVQVGAEELEHFPDGVFFVDLAAVFDPDAIAREIGVAVGAVAGGGAAQALNAGPAGPADDVLLAFLASRECLVIFDNCEHVLDACAAFADRILARCPKVSILATSREGLRVEGEQSWVVPSLTLPTDMDSVDDSEAVSLFKARARAVRPGFDLAPENIEAVVNICRRLDGIPLAIEFAAARMSHLSPKQIADRLDDRFRLLTGGHRRVQRQHTLHAALEWSYELLSETERVLLRRLSVFPGDFAIEAAEGICSDEQLAAASVTDLIGSLVSKSLVETALLADEARYRLLETVRAYAAEQLARADETEAFRSRHRDWYLDWLCAVPWHESVIKLAFSRALWREEANVTGALEWSIAADRPDLVARMASRVFTNLWSGSDPNLMQRCVALALQAEERLDPDDRVLCLCHALGTPFSTPGALDLADRAVAAAAGASHAAAVFALAFRGTTTVIVAALSRNDELAARSYADIDEAVRLAEGNDGMRVFVLWQRALVDLALGRPADAESPLNQGMQLAKASGHGDMEAIFGFYLALVAHVMDDDARAVDALRVWRRWADLTRNESTDRFPDRFPPALAAPFVALDAMGNGIEETWSNLRAVRDVALRSGWPTASLHIVLACAILHVLQGEHRSAAMLLSWVRTHTIDVGMPIPSHADYILYLRYRDIVRQALGPDDARTAREQGARLSQDDALDLAFGERTAT